MDFKVSFNEKDLEDREEILKMRASVEQHLSNLSDFGRNTLIDSILELRGALDLCEEAWFNTQRLRVLNLLCAFFSVYKDNEEFDEHDR